MKSGTSFEFFAVSQQNIDLTSCKHVINVLVATALLVAGPTLTLWIPTCRQTVCIHQLVFKPGSKAACMK